MKASSSFPAVAKPESASPPSNEECRPLQEFEGEDRELFLRAFFTFGGALIRDFKTGDRKIDAENEDGFGERFQLRWIMQRFLFASYEAMETLGVKPKLSVTETFSQELSK